MPISNKPQLQSPPFSINNVKVAFDCPRLFYLKHSFGGNHPFFPKDYIQEIDNTFLDLANQLMNMIWQESRIKVLFAGQFEGLVVGAIANQIQQLFYGLIFFPYLQTIITKDATLATALYQIWRVLTKMIFNISKIIVKNRRYCHESVVLHRTLIMGETLVDYTFKIPDGKTQKLTGKVNNLIFDFESRRLCVVHFQTYETVEVLSHLIGVALHSFLLKQKKKVPVDALVYWVLPELGEYYYSWEKLENVVESLVPNKLEEMRGWLKWEEFQPGSPPPTEKEYLCDICPQKERCQSFFDGGG
ncbi:MAG: PD-(D/E)XK nuclease family protein [Trichodesmium sp. St16_bin4-tuft]|nr:PD-(D/E)XK nuclease family protein [Trichodesmium sp. MAG_R01]MDE5069181.1 PD-(D/E)XK nuclease family protein [Trichodesmium sp. St4_bin8_1]MDE5077409.1 PD-(D/E)XK nuclease family protein [Trichodesmium sp. St2_bin6]MDE5091373.1 PD-(D/E)XK nuclease family protein [Trichodesmium sp. St18_bin3_1_1]MDE5099894.1 PD-(D/E)XK nuclease family protein [Trichodesmium sp. St16_bin4-tuft]MDE5103222.1 PD-(D/E)XK nuclease family protein [Trichodesmium sp. St19_bin2]